MFAFIEISRRETHLLARALIRLFTLRNNRLGKAFNESVKKFRQSGVKTRCLKRIIVVRRSPL